MKFRVQIQAILLREGTRENPVLIQILNSTVRSSIQGVILRSTAFTWRGCIALTKSILGVSDVVCTGPRAFSSLRVVVALALVGLSGLLAAMAYSSSQGQIENPETVAVQPAGSTSAAVLGSNESSAGTAASPIMPGAATAAPNIASTTTLFLAGVEQFGLGSGQIDLFAVTLGGNTAGSDTFAVGSPATLATTSSTNENKPDINNPADIRFDKSGDLLIANGGTSNADPGSFACVPAGAITTGANSSTTITQTGTNPAQTGSLAYDSRDGSAAIANLAASSAKQLYEYLLSGSYSAAGSPRNLVAPGFGSHSVVEVPSLPAGTYAVALTTGTEEDPSHGGAVGNNKIALFSPLGVETDITDDTNFSIDDPYGLAFDSQNNQLVIANNSVWHKLLSFYNVSPVSLVKTINTGFKNTYTAASPDGHVAVAWVTQFGYMQVQVFDNTAARNPVFGPIPYNGTTTSCGSTYFYGNGTAIVNGLRWLSNTKLLVAVESNNSGSPTAKNGFYIYDITNSEVPAGFDDVKCTPFAAAPINTGFQHITNHPFGVAIRNGSFAFADPAGTCNGNGPCFTSINSAISNVSAGGVVNVFGGTYNEAVTLNNSNVTVNIDANATVNSFTLTAGTLNSGGGLCAQAGGPTLTLASGNWTNNGGTFNPGGGTVAFTGSSAQTIGGSTSTIFNSLTVNNASGVTLSKDTTVGGTLTLTNGSLGVGTNTLTLNSAVGFTGGTIASSATGLVKYNQGSNAQNVAPGSYGNLTFSNFTKTLPNGGTVTVKIAGTFTVGATGGHTVTGSTIEFNGTNGAQTLPANFTTYNGLTINNASGVTLGGNITVNGLLTLTSGNVTTNANTLSIGSGGTRSRTSGYILGNEKKTYAGNISFTFDVGTANGYSPVDTTTTAGTGDLTVVAVQGPEPNVVSGRSLQRYWTLTKGGAGITANLVFHYLDPIDVSGNESNYQVLQVTGGARNYFINNCPNTCVNTAANTLALTGITSFSNFTAGEARADLQITGNTDSPDPVFTGNNLTYDIALVNNGPDAAQTVTVTNAVPANATFVSTTTPAGWSRTDAVAVGGTGSIVFAKGSVASAETAAFQVVVKVALNIGGSTITDNAVAASAVTTDPVPGNETGTATTLVYQPPAFTSANATTFTTGTNGPTFNIAANGFPNPNITLQSGTLPSGVTFTAGTNTATLSGTPGPGTGGIYNVVFKADGGGAGSVTQNFTLTVNQPPAITSVDNATFPLGTGSTFTVTTTGFPVPAIAKGGVALPSGVTYVDNGDGTGKLSGTPAAGTAGTYAITFTASNAAGTTPAQSFTLTVTQPPSITSANNKSFATGVAGTFTVTTGPHFPAAETITETGALPGGVTFVDNNDGTAILSGTPAANAGGTYLLTIKASNGVSPDATQSFTLTVNQAPVITSGNSTAFKVSTPGTFTVTTTGFPSNASMAISETGALPAGVSFVNNNDGTATLAGTPNAGTSGSYPVTITANNGISPNATQNFTLTVQQAPGITSGSSTTFKVGSAGTFTVTTSGFPTNAGMAISESGALPSGVTFLNNNDGTATLAGTPGAGAGGSYPFTITANNGVSPNANQSFILTVQQAPSFTSANSATFQTGVAGTFTVTTAAFPTVATISQTGTRPTGVNYVDNGNGTATISGTPAAGTGGAYTLTLTASNGVTPNAVQTYTLTVNQAPAITSGNSATFKVGAGATFAVTTTGFPTNAGMAISETGALPSGVTFVNNNDGTATLAGTPAAGTGGIYPLTITANNGISPNATQSFTLTVQQAPVITSAKSVTFQTAAPGTFTVTTTGFPTDASMAISESGALPSGVTFTNNNNGTATLAGTPGAGTAGSYPITITANNGVTPAASQSFTLTISDAPPTPTPTATATATATPTATATATATPTATATATPATTATATPSGTPSATPTAGPAQALNISTRVRVDTGDKVMIGGFIITGNVPKPVVLRGLGPSLVGAGIPAASVLNDPVLELHGASGALILSNDNWKDSPQRAQFEGTIFQPTDDRESVILATLPPAAYTVILKGAGGTTGVGVVEAYDNNQAVDSALANISTRGFVQTGNEVMIGGFVLGGNSLPARIAVRALGPSLTGVGLTNVLADPTLELHNANGTVMISNDDWQSDSISAAALTANGLALPDPKEAGIFTSLAAPGQFTAIVAGKNGGVGVALVEIYNVQ